MQIGKRQRVATYKRARHLSRDKRRQWRLAAIKQPVKYMKSSVSAAKSKRREMSNGESGMKMASALVAKGVAAWAASDLGGISSGGRKTWKSRRKNGLDGSEEVERWAAKRKMTSDVAVMMEQ